MQRPHGQSAPLPAPTVLMTEGWHCLHIEISLKRAFAALDPADRAHGRAEVIDILNPQENMFP